MNILLGRSILITAKKIEERLVSSITKKGFLVKVVTNVYFNIASSAVISLAVGPLLISFLLQHITITG